ncbi:protein ENHANCED DOWNY MILDEW [Trifolium repens]|nr:protein ENHANCED DOWNY MILDEW [Trifolium repens]
MFSVKHSLDITFDSGVLEISELDVIFSEDFLLPILLDGSFPVTLDPSTVLLPDDLTTPSSFFNLTLSLVVGFILLLEVLISRIPELVSGNFI